MTVEAGVLALRIQEQGADQVVRQLELVDQKAKSTDATLKELGKQASLLSQGVKFDSTRAQSMRELTTVEQQLRTQLGQTNLSLADRIKAETSLATVTKAKLAGMEAEKAATAGLLSRVGGLTAALGALGITLSAGAVIAGMVNVAREAIDAGDNFHDLAMRTGVSTEALSVFAQVAAKSGADTGVLTVGFRNLAKEVEKARGGNKEAIATFAALGLSVKDFAGLSLDQIFVKIADAQEKFADGSGKTAAMVQIFGRAGDQLIPTLHELADGGFDNAKKKAEGLGGVISDEFANKADAFNDQLEDLHTSLLGLGMVIADPLLPFMTRLADMFTTLIVKAQHFASVAANMLALTPLGPIIGLVNAALPKPFTRMGPTLEQLNKGRAKPDLPTIQKDAAATAEDRERERQLKKAGEVGRIGVQLTNTDPLVAGSFFTQLIGHGPADKLKGVKGTPAEVLKEVDAVFNQVEDKIKERTEKLRPFVESLAQTVGSAFGDAFSAAFKGGNFFKEFGKSLISSLGNIIMQLGEQMLAYGLIIAPLASLLNFTPFGSLGLGAGASIAAGLALTALGAAMGAVGGGGGKGGAGGAGGRGSTNGSQDNTFAMQFDPDGKLRKRSGPSVIPSSRALTNAAMPDARPGVQIGVLNALHPDDPRWQREISKTVKNAQDRGLLTRKAS